MTELCTLAALWLTVWWLARRRLPDRVLRRTITRSVTLNLGLLAVAPFVPLARWLHGAGLSKQWAGSIVCLLAVAVLVLVIVVLAKLTSTEERKRTGK